MSPRSEYATILFLREVFSLSVISHMEWKRSLYALWLFFLSGSVLAAVTAGTVRFFEQATKRELIWLIKICKVIRELLPSKNNPVKGRKKHMSWSYRFWFVSFLPSNGHSLLILAWNVHLKLTVGSPLHCLTGSMLERLCKAVHLGCTCWNAETIPPKYGCFMQLHVKKWLLLITDDSIVPVQTCTRLVIRQKSLISIRKCDQLSIDK